MEECCKRYGPPKVVTFMPMVVLAAQKRLPRKAKKIAKATGQWTRKVINKLAIIEIPKGHSWNF